MIRLFFGNMTQETAFILLCVLIIYGVWMSYLIIRNEKRERRHKDWLELRKRSKDKFGEEICYCGHTSSCSCGDPCLKTFLESVDRGSIIENDINNGWKSVNKE